MPQFGRGDFIFKKERGKETDYAICETKVIDLDSTGKTARTRRNHNRKKVKDQADYYFKRFLAKLEKSSVPIVVHKYYYTNETPEPKELL